MLLLSTARVDLRIQSIDPLSPKLFTFAISTIRKPNVRRMIAESAPTTTRKIAMTIPAYIRTDSKVTED